LPLSQLLREKSDKWRKVLGERWPQKNAGWNTPAGIDFSQSIYEKLAIDPRIDIGPDQSVEIDLR